MLDALLYITTGMGLVLACAVGTLMILAAFAALVEGLLWVGRKLRFTLPAVIPWLLKAVFWVFAAAVLVTMLYQIGKDFWHDQ